MTSSERWVGRDYEKINEYAKIFYQKFILLCQCLNSIISQGSCFGKNKEFFNLLKEVAQEKKTVHLNKSKMDILVQTLPS